MVGKKRKAAPVGVGRATRNNPVGRQQNRDQEEQSSNRGGVQPPAGVAPELQAFMNQMKEQMKEVMDAVAILKEGNAEKQADGVNQRAEPSHLATDQSKTVEISTTHSRAAVPPAGEVVPPPWLAEIKDMLLQHDRELKAQKGEFVRKTRPTASPFTPDVVAAPPPERGSLPTIKAYDGTGDPEEHICYFNKLAITFMLNDGMQCKLFATNLTGVARLCAEFRSLGRQIPEPVQWYEEQKEERERSAGCSAERWGSAECFLEKVQPCCFADRKHGSVHSSGDIHSEYQPRRFQKQPQDIHSADYGGSQSQSSNICHSLRCVEAERAADPNGH